MSRSCISMSPRTLIVSFYFDTILLAYWQVCIRAVKPVASGVPGKGGR